MGMCWFQDGGGGPWGAPRRTTVPWLRWRPCFATLQINTLMINVLWVCATPLVISIKKLEEQLVEGTILFNGLAFLST